MGKMHLASGQSGSNPASLTLYTKGERMISFEKLSKFKKGSGNPEIPWDSHGSVIYVHLASLIDLWVECYYSQPLSEGEERVLISRNSIRNTIKATPGFISHRICKRIGGKVYRCAVFNKKDVPKNFLEVLNGKNA